MNARLVSQLVRLYPQAWRTRYAEEFQSFLETHPSNLRTILNVIGGALDERALSFRRFKMDRRQKSLAIMLYAYLGAVAAGINFYWTVDDTPLAAAMHNYSPLSTSWNLVSAGSLLALAAFAAAGIPVFLTMARTAFAAQRWDIVCRLAAPLCSFPQAHLAWQPTGLLVHAGMANSLCRRNTSGPPIVR